MSNFKTVSPEDIFEKMLSSPETSENAAAFKKLSAVFIEACKDQPRDVVALVLADQVAIWIAAHFGPEDEIQDFRMNMMKMFFKAIWHLIPINDRLIRESMSEEEKLHMQRLLNREVGKPTH